MSDHDQDLEFDKTKIHLEQIEPLLDTIREILLDHNIPYLMVFMPKSEKSNFLMDLQAHYPRNLKSTPMLEAIQLLLSEKSGHHMRRTGIKPEQILNMDLNKVAEQIADLVELINSKTNEKH